MRELQAELAYDRSSEAALACELRTCMDASPRQAAAFDAITTAIDAGESKLFFVDGPGGTGKSFLFTAILHYVRGRGEIAVACSWNGLAASLLPGGRTCHARFGFPVPLPAESVPWRVTARTGKGQVLMKARIILRDEVSTTPARAMDAANACLQDLCGSELPFGGKLVIFGGDTRQTLPVVEGGSRADIVASAVTSSRVWANCLLIPISLDFNLRAATDPEFRAFLLRVGNGRQPFQLEYGPAAIFLPADIAAPHEWSLKDLLDFVYGDVVALSQRLVRDPTDANLDIFGKRALLAPKNDDVSKLNALLLDCFPPEQVQSFPSTTYISGGSPDDYSAYPVEFLNSLELSGLPPAVLNLCPGAIVILLRNLAYEQGLCNGTRCIVLQATARILDVMVLTGYSRGKRAWIPRIPLSPTETVMPVRIIRRQFPVRLAWAMTINKAQGQSLLRHLALRVMLLFLYKYWIFLSTSYPFVC